MVFDCTGFIILLYLVSYSCGFSVSPRFFKWFLDSTFFVFLFCHIGWSALWLSQTVLVFKLAHNVLQLQEVGDFEALNCLPPQNLIRSTKLYLTTEPPISCRCCYGLVFLSLLSTKFNFIKRRYCSKVKFVSMC